MGSRPSANGYPGAQSCTLAEIQVRNFRRGKANPPGKGAWDISTQFLAVAGYGAHLSGQEMVGRPGTSHDHLAIFKLLRGCAVAVLIFLDGFGIDEVSDIEQHSVGIDLLTADFFLERVEELVHLDGEGASFGLAFPITGCLFAEFDK